MMKSTEEKWFFLPYILQTDANIKFRMVHLAWFPLYKFKFNSIKLHIRSCRILHGTLRICSNYISLRYCMCNSKVIVLGRLDTAHYENHKEYCDLMAVVPINWYRMLCQHPNFLLERSSLRGCWSSKSTQVLCLVQPLSLSLGGI